ncbi:hypothetical protein [Dyadobacter sp. CY323]|uniref:hypothetical protein n=1 Tax=Dyadobacter sp. CY323 TaxID=2907302 RepID=UPI001F214D64|nr:hypothetical protein [Dyadobacter sp. CY323]MCE6989664.1 hypothetical protein [Dyadobacter sp. CY323]
MSNAISDTNIQKERHLITVRALRSRNFRKKLPFLILSEKLPEGQVYREFPDGRIEVQQVSYAGARFEAKVIDVLTPSDADQIRKEHELL